MFKSIFVPWHQTLVVAILIASAALPRSAAAQDPEAPPALFRDMAPATAAAADLPPNEDPTVARSRFVELRADVLTSRVVDPTADMPETAPVTLDLFDDVRVVLLKDQVERLDDSTMSWTGYVEGDENPTAAIIISRDSDGIDSLTGNVVVGGTLFQLRSVGGAVHEIREIDQDKFPDEAEPTAPELPLLGEAAPEADEALDEPPTDDGGEITVLVLFTARVEREVRDIESKIRLAVLETNQSYVASGIRQRIRLVHSQKVDYTESGNVFTGRERLRIRGDGKLDIAHTLRDQHAADVVSLWIARGNACGVAYIMEEVRPDFSPFGFSVVREDCATGYYSFGHELGHIMGARHDRVVDPTDGRPFQFNHGFFRTQPTDASCVPWRTIMGYNDGCDDVNVRCTRQKFWSNADRSYCGDRTGVNRGHPAAADNRETLNLTARTVAGFRPRG